jgi:hypothetical protein
LANITVARRQNALALFQAFAAKALDEGSPPKGLEQAFAATLQISPSLWSQIKSARPIGDKLARQIEHLAGPTARMARRRSRTRRPESRREVLPGARPGRVARLEPRRAEGAARAARRRDRNGRRDPILTPG